MAPALVLTEDAAAEHGYSGAGPFTFPGFPGLYTPGRPLEVSELDLVDADDLEEMIEDAGVPLELVDVEQGSGKAERDNHALSLGEVMEGEGLDDDAPAIRTHKQANAAAKELGFDFSADDQTVAQKVEAIEAFKQAQALEGDEMTLADDEVEG